MKMYIPEIGDKIRLTEDWSFRLFSESRNDALFKLLNIKERGPFIAFKGKNFYFQCRKLEGLGTRCEWFASDGDMLASYPAAKQAVLHKQHKQEDPGTLVTLKVGQVLGIDRIYIRKGAKDYSSVTFNYIGAPKGSGRIRFWAKLDDVNNIIFEKD